MRKTNIRPWTKEWAEQYTQDAQRLKEIFKEEVIDIFHIGSTSVPAIGYAKPIIDILIVVKEIEKVDQYNKKMEEIGYDARGENGISGRRYFLRGKDNRTHHVHIFQTGHEHIKLHLAFKNYFLQHPEMAKRYGDLKVALAVQFPEEHERYQQGKQSFVNEVVQKLKKNGELI